MKNISDTARWVAFYRAMESERPDAVFRDPWARSLAGPEGEAIVRAMPRGRSMAWPMITRTAVLDDLVLRMVREHQIDGVLNLAAGLDTRPWRLELPAELTWWDVDLPAMVAYKREKMSGETPGCRLEQVEVDLSHQQARRALFARVGAAASRVLVMTEGLLVYLEPEAVLQLARDLHEQPSFFWWVTDLASPALLQMLSKNWGPALERAGAPFKFGPAESTAFFEPAGWREVEWRGIWEEAKRIKRTMRFGWVINMISKLQGRRKQEEFRRFSGIALLERQA